MTKLFKAFAISGFIVFIAYLLALTYRYEPVAGLTTPGTINVLDRWHNRVCIVSIELGNKPRCSLEELDPSKPWNIPRPSEK